MRVAPSITINAANLISSTVSEPSSGEAAWNSTAIYKAGDTVINPATHRAFISLQGSQLVVAVSIASPAIVTWPNHGLAPGAPVVFTTTGALPSGLTAGTTYYVLADTVNTFKVAATIGGSAIATTGTQSGAHTATANPNIGHDPTTDSGLWWQDVGASNKWAMFDLLRNKATTGASPLTVQFAPGARIDTIGLAGLVADHVKITLSIGGITQFTYDEDLLVHDTANWYDYFFGDFVQKTETAVMNVPPYSSGVVTITLTRSVGNVSCAAVVAGLSTYLGKTIHGAENDALNFSKIDRDEDGNSILQQKRSVPKITPTTRLDRSLVNKALKARDDLNAVPALWLGLDDQASGYFRPLLVVGVYKRFTITMDQPNSATVSLQIEQV